jgi:hypothetical protein
MSSTGQDAGRSDIDALDIEMQALDHSGGEASGVVASHSSDGGTTIVDDDLDVHEEGRSADVLDRMVDDNNNTDEADSLQSRLYRQAASMFATSLEDDTQRSSSFYTATRAKICITAAMVTIVLAIILALGSVISIVVVYATLPSSSTTTHGGNGNDGTAVINERFYRPSHIEIQKHLTSIASWRNAFVAAVTGGAGSADMQSIEQQYFKDCWADEDYFRMVLLHQA